MNEQMIFEFGFAALLAVICYMIGRYDGSRRTAWVWLRIADCHSRALFDMLDVPEEDRDDTFKLASHKADRMLKDEYGIVKR
jgi:hypothetical protein